MKSIKLIDIIKNFDALEQVVIYQSDAFISKNGFEKIFKGSILDIPWYITEMYLDNDENGEAIGLMVDTITYENGTTENKPVFIIYVRETK